jgi:hypothetical protein
VLVVGGDGVPAGLRVAPGRWKGIWCARPATSVGSCCAARPLATTTWRGSSGPGDGGTFIPAPASRRQLEPACLQGRHRRHHDLARHHGQTARRGGGPIIGTRASVGRATLYRPSMPGPNFATRSKKLLDQSTTKELPKLEHDLADRLTEIRLFKDRLAALTTTVEHLVRDNAPSARRRHGREPSSPTSSSTAIARRPNESQSMSPIRAKIYPPSPKVSSDTPPATRDRFVRASLRKRS